MKYVENVLVLLHACWPAAFAFIPFYLLSFSFGSFACISFQYYLFSVLSGPEMKPKTMKHEHFFLIQAGKEFGFRQILRNHPDS